MNLIGRTSSLTACIVALAMATSPVMAQIAVTPPVPTGGEAMPAAGGTANPVVDTSVLPELPLARTGAAFPTGTRTSTLPAAAAAPTQPKPKSDVQPPGQSKWIILAALVVAGAVVAVVLLLHGGGDDKSNPKPTGTIITAGTPGVSTPQ